MDYYELSASDAAVVSAALTASTSHYGQSLRLGSRFDALRSDASRLRRRVRLDYDTSAQILAALSEDCSEISRLASDILRRESFGDSAHIADVA